MFLFCSSRHYIARARQHRPIVPQAISAYVVESYVRLRAQHKAFEQTSKSHSYTSARTLLGVLRLSQALARLRFGTQVEQDDVDEALRIMEKSKESLNDDDERAAEREGDRSIATRIYRLIKEMATVSSGPRRSGRGRKLGKGPGGQRADDMDLDSDEDDDEMEELKLVDIRQRIVASGFTETQLMETIIEVCIRFLSSDCRLLLLCCSLTRKMSPLRRQYEDIDVWTRTANGAKLRFVQ